MARLILRLLLPAALGLLAGAAMAQCPATVPMQGAPPPAPLPVFPTDNWWNLDVRTAPVDPGSSAYIPFINNRGTRRLHPDFGGEESPGSIAIYGMPYAVVDGAQARQAVTFQYWDESDGVDYNTGQGLPFYPIPAQAISQSHWVEGGAPANVDQRSQGDRHLLMIDCTNRHLYELYNVYYNTAQGSWYAGSGAFFDLNANDRRPDGWTSADAAGLAEHRQPVRVRANTVEHLEGGGGLARVCLFRVEHRERERRGEQRHDRLSEILGRDDGSCGHGVTSNLDE